MTEALGALYLGSVWMHIIAAAIWVGGMLFLVLVLMPALRRGERPERVAALTRLVGRRFRTVGWLALLVLVMTGIGNLAFRGIGWADVMDPGFWRGSFGHVLGMKLLLVGMTVLLSLIHDLAVGPRASEAWRAGQGEGDRDAWAKAQRLRRQATWIGRLNLLIAVVIVALGVMLVRGTP